MILVIDASVIIKWLLNDPRREPDTDKATALIEYAVGDKADVLQPTHGLLEVAAMLTRISPKTASDVVALLAAMELPADDAPIILQRAGQLAIDLKQHVFDTLYHAIAIENRDATLVTADRQYLNAANKLGRIVSLADWQPA